MGVYIKNMAMPKNCLQCSFRKFWDDEDQCLAKKNLWVKGNEIPPVCPLIELPPHGDLIDRSKLAWTPIDITDLPYRECLPVYLKEDVDDAPIVVESEE